MTEELLPLHLPKGELRSWTFLPKGCMAGASKLTTPLLGVPEGHTGLPHREGPHLWARTAAAAALTRATAVSGAPRLDGLVSAPIGWLSGAFLSTRQHPGLSNSEGTASGQIARLLEVGGETVAAIARDLWVLIETNRENTEDSRGPAFFFFFFLSSKLL